MSFTAKADLPFPNVPAYIIRQAVRDSNDNDAISIFRETFDLGKFFLRRSSRDIHEWITEYISEDIDTTWVRIQTIKDGNFGPHIDGPGQASNSRRYFNLLYIIDTGGDCVLTHFYKPNNPDIGAQTIFDYTDVTLIDTFQFKPNTWNLMNNQVIHSVEGISRIRLGISISLCSPELPEFLKKY